jgi:hypothetical protein
MSNSISGAGMEGINRGYQLMNQAATRIAKVATSETPTSDITRSAVELQQAKVQSQASAKVLETDNRVIGSLLDITV